ncbi:MAG: hypothetical protein AzoDbin1_02840 [Azoarcus sp.]|nr:hypothetical protein [Azoarcus sp.]
MYQLRLVVDANCLNAKGRLPAMNELQLYHEAGAIELIVTSTLAAEIDPGSSQAAKARTYQSVGGRMFSIQGVPGMQSMQGATLRSSQMALLHARLFPHALEGHALTRAVRDCLHIDQAQMNAADIFVTSDKRLHNAAEVLQSVSVPLAVASPERALIMVKDHVRTRIGTDDLQRTKAYVDGLGSIILGSNSVGNCSFTLGQPPETLLAFRVENGLLQVSGALRDDTGQVGIVLRPGQSPEFPIHKASLTHVGRGPLLVSSEPCASFVVEFDHRPVLAVRTSHTRRAVVFAMELRDSAGRVVAFVQNESLTLQGANVQFH